MLAFGVPLSSHLFGIHDGSDRKARRGAGRLAGHAAPAALPSVSSRRLRPGPLGAWFHRYEKRTVDGDAAPPRLRADGAGAVGQPVFHQAAAGAHRHQSRRGKSAQPVTAGGGRKARRPSFLPPPSRRPRRPWTRCKRPAKRRSPSIPISITSCFRIAARWCGAGFSRIIKDHAGKPLDLVNQPALAKRSRPVRD